MSLSGFQQALISDKNDFRRDYWLKDKSDLRRILDGSLYSVHDKNYLTQDYILLCHIFQKWSQQ